MTRERALAPSFAWALRVAAGAVAATAAFAACGHGGASATDPNGAASSSSSSSSSHRSGASGATDPTASAAAPPVVDPGVIDLLPLLRQGAIDVAGPVVDLGESQANPYVLPPLPVASETINGDSWVGVGPRLRVRVAINAAAPPTALRLRVRNVGVRGVVAIVDGLLARQAALPALPRPYTITLPISPDRFRRDVSEIELRFFGAARVTVPPRLIAPSAALAAATSPRPAGSPLPGAPASGGARAAAPARPLIELDWVHLVRDQTLQPRPGDPHTAEPAPPPPPSSSSSSRRAPPLPPVWVTDPMSAPRPDSLGARVLTPPTVRVNDLVADVRADAAPRRALTLYAPAALSFVTVIPPHATLRAALGAEGIRGQSAQHAVAARVRVEADSATPLELRAEVEAGSPWRDVALDLASLAGKAARITVAAEPQDGAATDTRLAVADPRLVTRVEDAPAGGDAGGRAAPGAARALPAVRHALLVVVRGARVDRFLPSLSPRLSFGGFARVLREGVAVPAVAASPRALSALASAVTGLPADVHGMGELTDTLDEAAPTLGSLLGDTGVTTAGFSDDRWWEGSGLDRGMSERGGCEAGVALCRAEGALVQAGEWLARQGDRRACAVVVTRAGTVPLDPPPDLLAALDPTPYEGALGAEQTVSLAARSRRGAIDLDARETARLAALYDAALAGVDRGLATALDRMRDAGTLRDTLIVIVGDRGTALGESGLVGEGPMGLAVTAHTILVVRAPGVPPGTLGETASVLDAVMTVLERFAAVPSGGHPAERAGAASLVAAHGASLHPRGVVLVGNARGELGLRFGELLALGRGAGGLALLQPESDPLGQNDLAAQRPIARAFADAVLGAYRSNSGDEPVPRVVYSPSTRALPAPVETALRNAGLLHR